MRMMIRASVPVDAGNIALKNGAMEKTIAGIMERLKPENAYFYSDHGVRTMIVIFNMNDTSEIPFAAEPLFSTLNAAVEFIPVMTAEDLKKGLAKIAH